MTALLYFLVAVLAAGLSTRAWLTDRTEPARQAFLGLGWSVAFAYGSFSLSLLPGLSLLRVVYMISGCSVPAFALWCIDRLFERDDGMPSTRVPILFVVTAIVAPTAATVHLIFFNQVPRASIPEVVAALFSYAALSLALYRLWQAHEATGLRVDKVRLRYLMAVAVGAVAFTILEQAARNFADPVDPVGLNMSSRGVILQGAIPPFSPLLSGVALYFLYHTLVMYRLLDLHELFSRLSALMFSASLLVVVDGVTVTWFGTFTEYPIHSTFQIFLASVLFLAAYDPLRTHITYLANRIFNRRGQQLTETLDHLRVELSTVISRRGLTDTLLSALHGSGRVPLCSVYLWDRRIDAFVRVSERGTSDHPTLKAVASQPYTEGFATGQPWYNRPIETRRARTNPEVKERVALLEAMNADLSVSFMSGDVVVGWINLTDDDWSDGFSAEEMQRVREVADVASVVLGNIEDFQALEEERRLAALGAMAAGLAHEIRNPLAGIKGAAQFLQGEALPDDSQEMLNVVVLEADRLNVVVSQFLDYARPFELRLAPDHINALTSHVLAVLRAQRIPEGIVVKEDLAGDLPATYMDRHRISQVLLNLLQNAVQAMPDGGTLSVSTRLTRHRSGSRKISIAVADTGMGIASEDMPKLFAPFYTTKRDGTGLGLAICKRIIQAHEGELDVQSQRDRGTTFVITLPIHPVMDTEEAPAP